MNISGELQQAVEAARARIRVGYPWWLRRLLFPDVIAITLGRTIFVSPRFAGRPAEEVERLVRHELVHVRQVVRMGVIRFYARYAAELVRHFAATGSLNAAYHRVSFEIEAYAAEDETPARRAV